MTDLGKNVLLFEGGKTLHLDRIVTKVGIAGSLRVMQHLGMRNFERELALIDSPSQVPIYVKDSSWIRASHSGMWRADIRIGEYVQKGERIGTISNPYGNFEEAVLATKFGYIICNNHAPIVNQGDAIIHITTEVEDSF